MQALHGNWKWLIYLSFSKVHLQHQNIEKDLSQMFYFSAAALGLSSTVLPRLEHDHMWANFPLQPGPYISQNIREEEHVCHLTTQ